MDVDTEGDRSPLFIGDRPLPDGERLGSVEREAGEDSDAWEAASSVSDAPSEVLVEEDDDDVVPFSFNLSTLARCSDDDDRSTPDENPLDLPPLQPREEPSPGSPTIYGSDSGFLRSSPPCNSPLTQPTADLQYDQPLSGFGYALNASVKAAICVGCHRGVPVEMLGSHSKIHHPGRSRPSPAEQTAITERLHSAGYRTSKEEKYHQPPGQKPVDGLEVLKGFCCPLPVEDGTRCSKGFHARTTFIRHLGEHRGDKPDPSSCASDIQTLFSQGSLQKYFSVNPSLSSVDPSSSAACAYAIKMLESLPEADIPIPDHDKDRATIDWFTRWPDLLKPYITDSKSLESLQSLVNFPDPEMDPVWLTKLRDHGTRWWKDAETAHVSCSYRASVMLKCHQK
jgi:hypothetical protein